jgi:hypothetical protein
MKLTKRHMIYGVLVAGAVAVVLVDRLVLDPGAAQPSPAGASVADGVDVRPARTSDGDRRAGTNPATLSPSVARRFAAYMRGRDVNPKTIRDAFQLAGAWREQLLRQPKPRQVAPKPDATNGFAQRHRLTTILISGAQGMAVVDGHVLGVGDILDGMTLVEIRSDRAVFRRGETLVGLELRPKHEDKR